MFLSWLSECWGSFPFIICCGITPLATVGPTLYNCYTNVLCLLGMQSTPTAEYNLYIPGSTTHQPCVGAMLGQRCRRLFNIAPTLGWCIVFADSTNNAHQSNHYVTLCLLESYLPTSHCHHLTTMMYSAAKSHKALSVYFTSKHMILFDLVAELAPTTRLTITCFTT